MSIIFIPLFYSQSFRPGFRLKTPMVAGRMWIIRQDALLAEQTGQHRLFRHYVVHYPPSTLLSIYRSTGIEYLSCPLCGMVASRVGINMSKTLLFMTQYPSLWIGGSFETSPIQLVWTREALRPVHAAIPRLIFGIPTGLVMSVYP